MSLRAAEGLAQAHTAQKSQRQASSSDLFEQKAVACSHYSILPPKFYANFLFFS